MGAEPCLFLREINQRLLCHADGKAERVQDTSGKAGLASKSSMQFANC
jgi:hypothetical protein